MDYLSTEMLGWKAKDTITGYVTFDKPVIEESGVPIELYFCPADDCESVMVDAILSARSSVDCAFFDLDLPKVISALETKSQSADVSVVVDDNNFEDVSNLDFITQDTSSQYMHNKFCVIDDELVLTGSFNPTYNGANVNANNLLVITSDNVAKNYADEFDELINEDFGGGKRTKKPLVILDGVSIKNYFCPDDWCATKIIDELDKANHSVKFLTFSFTSEPIARELIMLHERNISVSGVFERQQNSKYSKFETLSGAGLDVKWDSLKGKLHHKVFIIDDNVVITGSMNPTSSGDNRNDENILIIEDPLIASGFVKEFEKLSS